MAEQTINLKIIRSHTDQSVYNIQFTLSPSFDPQSLQISAKEGDFFIKEDPLGFFNSSTKGKCKLAMPLSGTILERKENLRNSEQKSPKSLIFVIRICQHEPDLNKQPPKTSSIIVNPLLKARLKCKLCREQIWYYYSNEEKSVTFYEFQSKFDDFNLESVQWKVILNQSFTKNTELASNGDDIFCLSQSGKVTFLQNLAALAQSSNPDPDHVVMRYKEVICNHERIADGICQFCLTPIKDIELDDFRFYLFQMDSESNSNMIMRGRALSDQELLFKAAFIGRKKTLLVLDLDNTILHSMEYGRIDEELLEQIQDYVIIPTQEFNIPIVKTLVKIRPFFKQFLSSVTRNYEIFVYTKGTRLYAEMVCLAIRKKYHEILEGTKNFMSFRILSRDEDPDISKKKLTYILPTLKDFLLILDDRRDVWDHSPYCVFTKPYYYFTSLQYNKYGMLEERRVQWQKGGGSLGETELSLETHNLLQQSFLQIEKALRQKQQIQTQFRHHIGQIEGNSANQQIVQKNIEQLKKHLISQEEQNRTLMHHIEKQSQAYKQLFKILTGKPKRRKPNIPLPPLKKQFQGEKTQKSGEQSNEEYNQGQVQIEKSTSKQQENVKALQNIEVEDLLYQQAKKQGSESQMEEQPKAETLKKQEGKSVSGNEEEKSQKIENEEKENIIPFSEERSEQSLEQIGEGAPINNQALTIQLNEGGRKRRQRSRDLQKIGIMNHQDYYLAFSAHALKKIHQEYYKSHQLDNSKHHKTGAYSDTAYTSKYYKKSLLTHITAKFLLPSPALEKRATYLGIKILPVQSQETPIVVIVIRPNILPIHQNDKKTKSTMNQAASIELVKKLKHFSQVLKVPVVSETWISACYEYTYGLPYDNFVVQPAESVNLLKQNKNYEFDKVQATLAEALPKVLKQIEQ